MNALLILCLLATPLTYLMVHLSIRYLGHHFVDTPDPRKLHLKPTPRIGGLAMTPAFLIAAWWLPAPFANSALVALTLLLLISTIDDARGLHAMPRLLVHLLAAAIFLYPLLFSQQAVKLPLLLWPVFVLVANLYNFKDGADGLAGGMAVFGFAGYGAAFALAGMSETGLACAVLALSALGFLFWNFPPAKTFMGDAGSISLGFLAGAFGLTGVLQGVFSPWFPAIVFAPFWVDTLMVLAWRALRGKRVTEAHQEHAYQRLVIGGGWSHRQLAVAEYGLMACGVTLALLTNSGSDGLRAVLGSLFIIAVALLYLVAHWRYR